MSEIVRQPAYMGCFAKFIEEVSLSQKERTAKGFTAGQVAITLGPHSPGEFKSTLGNIFLNLFE